MARVLIIEDEVLIARQLERIVESIGHNVVGIAKDANAAMQLAEDNLAEVALVDITIKGDRDGIALAAYLNESFGVRILFVTSNTSPETIKRASAINPFGFIVKPFSSDSIAANLQLALQSDSKNNHAVNLETLADASTHSEQLPKSLVTQIGDFVARRLSEEITLRQMADIAEMSESTFSRRFKNTVGTTPYKFVLQERIEESKRLLRDTNWSIVDIACGVGFSSQSHFTTAFKKAVNLTPLAYRKIG